MGAKHILAILVGVYLIGVLIGLVFQVKPGASAPVGSAVGTPMPYKAVKNRQPTEPARFHVVKPLKPVKPGDLADLALSTQPGTVCTIRVILPLWLVEGNQVVDPFYQSATPDGICQWQWIIPKDTPKGNYKVIVSVAGKPSDFYMSVLP